MKGAAGGDDEIALLCPVCGTDTAHDLEYAGRLVLNVRCLRCGTETSDPSPHLVNDYMGDLGNRLLTKPGRLLRRLRRDPLTTTRETVGSLARQPGKLAREIRAVLDASRRGR